MSLYTGEYDIKGRIIFREKQAWVWRTSLPILYQVWVRHLFLINGNCWSVSLKAEAQGQESWPTRVRLPLVISLPQGMSLPLVISLPQGMSLPLVISLPQGMSLPLVISLPQGMSLPLVISLPHTRPHRTRKTLSNRKACGDALW